MLVSSLPSLWSTTKVCSGRGSRHCLCNQMEIGRITPCGTYPVDAITRSASRRAASTVHPNSARIEGGQMQIIGCYLHARQQTLAMLDTTTGEVVEKNLTHEVRGV